MKSSDFTYMKTTNFNKNYIIEKYEIYPLLHKYVGKPQFLKFIGDVNRKDVLDLGCGSGHITYELYKKGANCIGVDISKEFIQLAKKTYSPISFYQLRGSDLIGIKSKRFDKVVMSLILVNVHNRHEFKGIFRECARVLKSRGELVFSVLHPLLIRDMKDSLRDIRLPKSGNYFKNGMIIKVKSLLTNLSFMTFNDAHWTLENISKELKDNNFVITELREPKTRRNKYWNYLKDELITPEYLFLRARLED